MKKFLVLAVTVLFCSAVGVQLAGGKPPFKTALGVANCNVCHADADKKVAPTEPDRLKLYNSAKDMVAKMKAGEGDYKGKTACNDCHQGKQKPAK